VDLGLSEHHRIEPACDREQVDRRVLFPVGVEGVGELVGVDAPRLHEEPLQGHEAGVVGGDVAVDLDPVACRQDDGAGESIQFAREQVRLGQVVVGEGEPIQQFDRRATEGDPEGEDGHEQVGRDCSHPAATLTRACRLPRT
jgi:hypothetical protein